MPSNSAILFQIAEFPSFCSWIMLHYVYTVHFLYIFIHWETSWSHDLAVVKNAAMNKRLYISLQDSDFFFRYIARHGIARSYGIWFLISWGIYILFFIKNVPIYIPKFKCSFFSMPLPTFVISHFSDNSHFNRCEIVSHCSFDLYFCDDLWLDFEHLPMYPLAIWYLLWKK